MTGAAANEITTELLKRLANEARHISSSLAELDQLAGEAALRGEALQGPWLQQVDLTRQESQGLATVLTRLAELNTGCESFDLTSACADLTLQAQRQRLSAG